MQQKLLIFLIAAFLFLKVSGAHKNNEKTGQCNCHSWKKGNCTDLKKKDLAFTGLIDKKYKFLDKISHTVDKCFSKPISCIIVEDNWNDGTGGKAWINEGGVGEKCVTVCMESQFSRGMSFTIEIYLQKELNFDLDVRIGVNKPTETATVAAVGNLTTYTTKEPTTKKEPSSPLPNLNVEDLDNSQDSIVFVE